MTREKQIKLHATIAGRQEHRTVELLVDGAVALGGLHAAAMRAINAQHPHEAGRPIVAIKYDVKANAA